MYPAYFDGMPGTDDVTARVLVAEDDFLIRLDMAESIRSLGWIVVEVSTADEAIELINCHVEFDLVVTDLNMPGHNDGRELARYVRSKSPSTKVVMVTSEPKPAADDVMLYDLFLRKPVWDLAPQIVPLMRKAGRAG